MKEAAATTVRLAVQADSAGAKAAPLAAGQFVVRWKAGETETVGSGSGDLAGLMKQMGSGSGGAAVKGALSQVTQRGLSLGTAAVLAKPDVLTSPSVVKVVTDDDDRAMYFSRAPIPFLRDNADAAERDARVLHHVGVYAYTPESLERWIGLPTHPLERIERLEQLRPLAAGMRMGVAVIQGPLRPGIDTEADLERANREWQTSTVMDD